MQITELIIKVKVKALLKHLVFLNQFCSAQKGVGKAGNSNKYFVIFFSVIDVSHSIVIN